MKILRDEPEFQARKAAAYADFHGAVCEATGRMFKDHAKGSGPITTREFHEKVSCDPLVTAVAEAVMDAHYRASSLAWDKLFARETDK